MWIDSDQSKFKCDQGENCFSCEPEGVVIKKAKLLSL